MLTIHTALGVMLRPTRATMSDTAVAVEGTLIAAIGPPAELAAVYPAARTRSWNGTLAPALLHDGPIPEADSPRERVHALLRSGVGRVTVSSLDGDPEAAALRAAAARVGLTVVPAAERVGLSPGARADLAVFGVDGRCVATILAGRLVHRRA